MTSDRVPSNGLPDMVGVWRLGVGVGAFWCTDLYCVLREVFTSLSRVVLMVSI